MMCNVIHYTHYRKFETVLEKSSPFLLQSLQALFARRKQNSHFFNKLSNIEIDCAWYDLDLTISL